MTANDNHPSTSAVRRAQRGCNCCALKSSASSTYCSAAAAVAVAAPSAGGAAGAGAGAGASVGAYCNYTSALWT